VVIRAIFEYRDAGHNRNRASEEPYGKHQFVLFLPEFFLIGKGCCKFLRFWYYAKIFDSFALSIAKKMNSPVDGAPDGTAAFVQNVSVDHCCGNVLVPEQFLHRADVVAVRKELCCKAMPKAVVSYRLMDAGKEG
jgi:hypothetical protein